MLQQYISICLYLSIYLFIYLSIHTFVRGTSRWVKTLAAQHFRSTCCSNTYPHVYIYLSIYFCVPTRICTWYQWMGKDMSSATLLQHMLQQFISTCVYLSVYQSIQKHVYIYMHICTHHENENIHKYLYMYLYVYMNLLKDIHVYMYTCINI